MDYLRELSSDKLQTLLQAPCETTHLDFKESLNLSTAQDRAKLAKHVLAMANSGGGHIVIGVEDKTRRLVGVSEQVVTCFRESKDVNDKLYTFTGGHITVAVAQHSVQTQAGSVRVVLIYIPHVRPMVPAQANGCYEDA